MRAMQAFNKEVNAGIVDPAFIIQVRKKLKLGQRVASEIFWGDVNAFSRYENGKTKPPRALVKLLKLLDRHPDLLHEKSVTVNGPDGRVTVCLRIVPDEDNPYATLSAQDEGGDALATVLVGAGFKLNRQSAQAWVDAGFEKPRG